MRNLMTFLNTRGKGRLPGVIYRTLMCRAYKNQMCMADISWNLMPQAQDSITSFTVAFCPDIIS